MRLFLSVFFLFSVFNLAIAQTLVSGIVITENGLRMPNVIVVNIATGEKTTTNAIGEFRIKAQFGQQLRFVKEYYERASVIVTSNEILEIKLIKIAQEIEAVEVSPFRVTGNINDASQIKINNSKEQLRQSIGLPKAPEKPRERAPEVKDVLVPLLFAQLNVDALYKVVSGKAKQMKRQYRYEDQQEGIAWMRANIGDDYIVKSGVPTEHINAFLLFCLSDEQVLRYVKAKNTAGAMVAMENMLPEFSKRLNDLKHRK